jgi:hypothetical protein
MLAITTQVIAGLDPAIHHLKNISWKMDTRVKPAYDELKKNGRTDDAA